MRGLKQLAVMLAGAALLLSSGCGGGGVKTDELDMVAVTLSPPAALAGQTSATWTAHVVGSVLPYSLHWDFGGGADPNTVDTLNLPGTTQDSAATVEMIEGNWQVTLTLTSSTGSQVTQHAAYTVGPTPALHAAAVYAAGQLTVTTNRDTAPDLAITVDAPVGLSVGAVTPSLVNGHLGALIPLTPVDSQAGAAGDVTVHVSDGAHGATEVTVHIAIPALDLPAYNYAPDTLYAIPVQTTAGIGQPVTVVVATGALASPFLYMTGVALTVPADGSYVQHTFNVGALGGRADAADGLWAAVHPTGGFLTPDGLDYLLSTDIGSGLSRWDINLTPLGGTVVTGAAGALFNLAFRFSQSGVKTFGFQHVSGVKRTYYSDDVSEHDWSNLANAGHGGIPNAVTVQ